MKKTVLDFNLRYCPEMAAGDRVLVHLPHPDMESIIHMDREEFSRNFRSCIPDFSTNDRVVLVNTREQVLPLDPFDKERFWYGPDLREERFGTVWTVAGLFFDPEKNQWFVSLKEFNKNDSSWFEAKHFRPADIESKDVPELAHA